MIIINRKPKAVRNSMNFQFYAFNLFDALWILNYINKYGDRFIWTSFRKKNTCFRYIIKWQTSDIYEYILRIFNTAIFPLSIAIPSWHMEVTS